MQNLNLVPKASLPLSCQTVRLGTASNALCICRTTLWNLIERGVLPTVKVGNRYVIPVAALEAFIAKGGESGE